MQTIRFDMNVIQYRPSEGLRGGGWNLYYVQDNYIFSCDDIFKCVKLHFFYTFNNVQVSLGTCTFNSIENTIRHSY